MMEKNPLLNRLMNEETADVVHSSAYAEAQNAKKMGVASTVDFAKRQAIEENRQVIKSYRDSRIVGEARGGTAGKAKRYDRSEDAALVARRPEVESGSGRETRGDEGVRTTKRQFPTGVTSMQNQISTPPARRNPGISR